MIILASLLALGVGFAIGFAAKPNPTARIAYPPEHLVRGPNADIRYHCVSLEEGDFWFTWETMVDAKERAERYSQ